MQCSHSICRGIYYTAYRVSCKPPGNEGPDANRPMAYLLHPVPGVARDDPLKVHMHSAAEEWDVKQFLNTYVEKMTACDVRTISHINWPQSLDNIAGPV